MDEDVQDPFGYASPPHSPDRQCAALPGSGDCVTPPAGSPRDAEGTPKVPLLPFGGRPGRSCPGAPRKGRAPNSFYDVSGEAPVRRLSFGTADSDGCASPEPCADVAMDGVEDNYGYHQQQQQHGQQQQLQLQHTPSAPSQPGQLDIPRQAQSQEQLLLSPSPPPVQQQLWSHQHMSEQQQPRPACVQQQLFMPSPQGSSWQLRPQQLWPCQNPPPQFQQQQQLSQQQQPQQLWPNPLSPPGAMRPSAAQGSTTPARLFR